MNRKKKTKEKLRRLGCPPFLIIFETSRKKRRLVSNGMNEKRRDQQHKKKQKRKKTSKSPKRAEPLRGDPSALSLTGCWEAKKRCFSTLFTMTRVTSTYISQALTLTLRQHLHFHVHTHDANTYSFTFTHTALHFTSRYPSRKHHHTSHSGSTRLY